MPVPRNDAAVTTLNRVLHEGHHDRPDELSDYTGYELHEPDGWLWQEPQQQPPLLDPDAYRLADALAVEPDLHAPPATTIDAGSGSGEAFTAAQREYCRRSLDVTMKGGTTSGVIYPLALCELARQFRFRNLGGASAGAIAAALAAAAELGRVRAAGGARRDDARTAEQVAQGRLRQGFAGLAEVAGWLTQADRPQAAEEFRLVQLFKPTLAGLPLFRVIAAAMRRQYVRGALLLLVSLDLKALALTLGPFLIAPLVLSVSAPWRWGPGPWWSPGNYAWSALLLWLSFAWLIPLVALVLTLPRRAPRAAPAGFAEPVPVPPPPVAETDWVRSLVVVVVAATGWVLAAVHALGAVGLLITLVVLVAEMAFVLVGFIIGIATFSATAKDHRFGLVGGSGAATDDATWRGRLARVFDGAAGILPRPTVAANLTDWLSSALADLAGLGDGEVLRFGHLWAGGQYTPGDPDGAGRRASDDPRLRSVNLELMSTELVRRSPYRFPLPAVAAEDEEAERLWFDPGDLTGLLPQPVIDAMTLGARPRRVRSLGTGLEVTLYPFPDPWDLPVLFATRASLALPALFQAVRLYELREGSEPVRTEFGARLSRHGEELRFPGRAGTAPVAQELWLTDGGVTSNFPIHMFDSPLPLWPTVGIDLATHPAGAAHQDVYLLGDARAAKALHSPLARAMSGFLGAVIGTSLQWRDNAQLQMPAFQARIAVVRQRGYEGGNNLFMTRSDIASLALRGVVAGMRLRRRFASDAQWRRQQWLRTRVAAENLVDLAGRLRTSLREDAYRDFDLDALRAALVGQADPNPPEAPTDGPDAPVDWYPPTSQQAFADNLATLTEGVRDPVPDPDVLREGAPRPLAELRQVPRS
ncbi:patatin-like phospholipase family protein [Micropruina sonneratiae]|uniref:patatin-like phospholipase family protein n=1 Tax=Micropruina sonneratiae TaxID=2986940 RepID=UPI002226EE65|nr:patatin-like phospholipase family protein [Micropruina sp. KQZ13P-5]MCW3156529.1 patatin-like phospholipase family protein [Micropruina sp. KQZ13P-5]